MRVDKAGSSPIQNTETSSAKKTGKTSKSEKKEGTSSSNSAAVADSVKTEISPKAKEYAKAKELAGKSPDVREEKIAEIRKRIASGQYKVDADAVADRMVTSHLEMS